MGDAKHLTQQQYKRARSHVAYEIDGSNRVQPSLEALAAAERILDAGLIDIAQFEIDR